MGILQKKEKKNHSFANNKKKKKIQWVHMLTIYTLRNTDLDHFGILKIINSVAKCQKKSFTNGISYTNIHYENVKFIIKFSVEIFAWEYFSKYSLSLI